MYTWLLTDEAAEHLVDPLLLQLLDLRRCLALQLVRHDLGGHHVGQGLQDLKAIQSSVIVGVVKPAREARAPHGIHTDVI